MDGSDRRSDFITTSLQLPNSLTVDFERDELCWADAGVHKIGIKAYSHVLHNSLGLLSAGFFNLFPRMR